MSGFDWNDALRLPCAALAGDRRIPKTVLTRQAQLTKTEQKVLDRIGALTHYASVQKSTTRIPPAQDDERDIQSVLFLRCEMARGSAYAEVAHLIHKCFPNPTIIFFDGESEVCISVATTRRSHAEQGAAVIDTIESTGAFDPAKPVYAPFLDALALNRLPQTDLLVYLQGIAWAVRLSRAIPSLGFYPSCAEGDRQRLGELIENRDALATQVGSIQQRRRNRDLTLNESAKLRMELKGLEKELDRITDAVKEICHAR